MSSIDDFWDSIAIQQMASGTAPSVVTKDMRQALDGDRSAVEKIKTKVNVDKEIIKGLQHRKVRCY